MNGKDVMTRQEATDFLVERLGKIHLIYHPEPLLSREKIQPWNISPQHNAVLIFLHVLTDDRLWVAYIQNGIQSRKDDSSYALWAFGCPITITDNPT